MEIAYKDAQIEVWREGKNWFAEIQMASGWAVCDCPHNFRSRSTAIVWAMQVVDARLEFEHKMKKPGIE